MDIWAASLVRRIRAMHRLWEIGVRDLTIEQVNHCEREGVLPIAFSLLHFVRSEDNATSRYILGNSTLWENQHWAEKIGVNVDDVGRGVPMEVAGRLQFSDVDAWRTYQTAVFTRTESALALLPEERYNELPFGPTLPESMDGAFISYAIQPGQPPTLLDVLECFIYQHGIRHLGELEHARSLVGLRGTS